MNRKRFLKGAAGSALASSIPVSCREPDETDEDGGQPTLSAIGLQLYTVRQLMAQDMAQALRRVAEAGYDEVEFTGYHGESPERVRALVEAHGLVPVSAHVPLELFRSDFDGLLAAAATVGHRYLVVPSLPPEERASADAYRRLAGELNRLGERCLDAGLTMGYHNHDFELRGVDGVRGLDVLLDETDPGPVTFEMDVYWTRYGGGDPAAYLREWPSRFRLCHVKDMDANRRMVDVGDGVIDWTETLRRARDAGMMHFFVEHDTPADPLATARRSYRYLSGLTS